MAECQDGLDEARGSGGGVGVPDVGLDGADGAETPVVGVLPEGPGERRDLDRVAERGRRAVRLHVRDGARIGARRELRLPDGGGLAGDTGRGETDPAGAVVGHGRPADDSPDVVAVGQRVGQALEHHHPDPVARDGAVPLGVEGAADAVGRQSAVRSGPRDGLRRYVNRDAARQGQVAVSGEQAPPSRVDGHQSGGAGRLHGDGRAPQPEPLGRAGDQEVGCGTENDVLLGDPGEPAQLGRQRLGVPGLGAAAVDTDGAGEPVGVGAGVLQGCCRALQEDPVLRVDQQGFLGGVAEVVGVEPLGAVQPAARGHVREVATVGRATRMDLRRIVDDRVDSGRDIGPEFLDVGGAGKSAGHSDDGDETTGFRQGFDVTHRGLRGCPREFRPAAPAGSPGGSADRWRGGRLRRARRSPRPAGGARGSERSGG